MVRSAIIWFVLLSCASALSGKSRVLRDLPFGTTPNRKLVLDLYLPAAANAPLVVWIHGGAWRAGTKDTPLALFLVSRGFAVASISYRLSQEAVFPAQIYDCKVAIRWLRAHASAYGYNAHRIGVWGSSAGGHLAALLGTTGGIPELEGTAGYSRYSSRVQAVVDFFGPTDLTRMSTIPGGMDHNAQDSPGSQLVGGPVQQNRKRAERANPIHYVSKGNPPFLIVHGSADNLVLPSQSELLHEALRRAGVPVAFRVVPGAGHGGPEFETPELQAMVEGFFRRYLR